MLYSLRCIYYSFLLVMIFATAQEIRGQQSQTPVELSAAYTADLFANLRGGNGTGVRYLDNIDADMLVDLEQVAGIARAELYVYGLGNQGGSISELAADVQGISNIEAENSWRLYEAWYRQSLPMLRSSVLVGLYDINSEFDVIKTGLLFINSSHGIGAAYGSSGVLGPSIFPYTSLGGRLKINPVNGVTIKAAMMDGIPSDSGDTEGTNIILRADDGALISAEISYSSAAGGISPSQTHTYLQRGVAPLEQSRFVLGGWLYTQPRAGWLTTGEREYGAYLSGESKLYDENKIEGLAGFIRLGLANGTVNQFSAYFGSGLVYTGVFAHRNEDRLGLAVALANNSSSYQTFAENSNLRPAGYEMNVETTYLFIISNHIQLQLDVQYVLNPGASQDTDNALVTGLRTIVAF